MREKSEVTNRTQTRRSRFGDGIGCRGFAGCSGFAVIGFLVSVPVLLAVVCVAAAAALLLKADTETSFQCDSKAYQLESDIASSLNKLLALNPKASKLIRERKVAERCVMTAVTPPTEAACNAKLMAVITAQGILATEQQAIIMKANADSMVDTSKLRAALTHASPNASSPTLQVDAKQKDEVAPEYEARRNIELVQKVNVTYQLAVKNIDSAILRLIVYRGPMKLNRSCAATVTKRGVKYVAQMTNGGGQS